MPSPESPGFFSSPGVAAPSCGGNPSGSLPAFIPIVPPSPSSPLFPTGAASIPAFIPSVPVLLTADPFAFALPLGKPCTVAPCPN